MTARKTAAKGRAKRTKKADPPAAATVAVDGALVKALARILGEAHEPMSLEDVQTRLFRAHFRVADTKVTDALAQMVADGNAVENVGGAPKCSGARWWHPGAGKGAKPAPKPAESSPVPMLTPEEASEVIANSSHSYEPPPPPHDPLVLAAAAPRKRTRIVMHCDAAALEQLTAGRNTLLAVADDHAQKSKALVREAKLRTKWIRQGFTVAVVETATVPDLARGLLVTYDMTAEPVELKTRRLPDRYRQTSLPGLAS